MLDISPERPGLERMHRCTSIVIRAAPEQSTIRRYSTITAMRWGRPSSSNLWWMVNRFGSDNQWQIAKAVRPTRTLPGNFDLALDVCGPAL
jgi:hypothetical protein